MKRNSILTMILALVLALPLAGCGQTPAPITDEQIKDAKICVLFGIVSDKGWDELEVCFTELLSKYGIDILNQVVDKVVDSLDDEYIIAIAELFDIFDEDATISEIKEGLKLVIKSWLKTLLGDSSLRAKVSS
jgi:hypothetical protein